jgi:Na+/H+-dicarboxylate symporter
MTGCVRGWFAISLWKRVIGALVIGAALGVWLPGAAPSLQILGDLFVRLIKMLVAPIVLATIVAGIVSLGDPRRLGAIGGRAAALFALTTLLAVAIGMSTGLVLRPGAGVPLTGVVAHVAGTSPGVDAQILGIVPANIFAALAGGDMLSITFIALLLGIGVVVAGEAGKPVAALFTSLAGVLLNIVRWVMELTPFGVLALIANAVASNGAAVFVHVGWLAVGVVVASLAQTAFVHGAIVSLLARSSFARFLRGIADALIIGFSTASSAATLPVAIRVAQDNLGVARPIAATVLPLGASIGKDGTSLYIGLLGQFALQSLGITPNAGMLVIMLATGALAAFSTAPIPGQSLFMLAAMLQSVGVDPDQTALVVGLVLPFDRLLDMTRTVPSVCANLAITLAVAQAEGGIDRERLQAEPRE